MHSAILERSPRSTTAPDTALVLRASYRTGLVLSPRAQAVVAAYKALSSTPTAPGRPVVIRPCPAARTIRAASGLSRREWQRAVIELKAQRILRHALDHRGVWVTDVITATAAPIAFGGRRA